jgi:hypothetical protein
MPHKWAQFGWALKAVHYCDGGDCVQLSTSRGALVVASSAINRAGTRDYEVHFIHVQGSKRRNAVSSLECCMLDDFQTKAFCAIVWVLSNSAMFEK